MSTKTIRVDQCLFGYDDGHRLLASSLALGDSAATLSHLSDLAPGTYFGSSAGYWTGVPLPKLKRYVLMHTWPAPEMPRPGCVWTHALLLDPTIFDQLSDLFQLKRGFRRPSGPNDHSSYRDPAPIELDGGVPGGLEAHAGPMAVRLLDALYDGEGKVLSAVPGTMDELLFAIWSQQWPRLRRNFRFQTAVSRHSAHGGDFKFDVLFDLHGEGAEGEPVVPSVWRNVALEDLLDPSRSNLRPFLRRYGADVRKQRGSFRPLCELSILKDAKGAGRVGKLLEVVERAFPEPDDAVQLKQDLVDGRLAPEMQLEILSLIIADKHTQQLPRPSEQSVAELAHFLPSHEKELVALAEEAAGAADVKMLPVLHAITSALPADRFWSMTTGAPRVRKMLVKARPELLLAPGVDGLDDTLLADFLDAVPEGSRTASMFIDKMLERSDPVLVAAVFERFPLATAEKVIDLANRSSAWPPDAWLRCLVARPSLLLDAGLIAKLDRSSLVFDVADALGWVTAETARRGVKPWLPAFSRMREDLHEERRDVLYAFLLVLAFHVPGDDARAAIEKSFPIVHSRVLASKLSWKAQQLLNPHLPDLGWMENWDVGLKLRIAVTYSYIVNAYDPASFARLASDRRVRDQMADAAIMLRGGKKYEKSARQ